MKVNLFAKLRSRLVNTHPQNNVLRLIDLYSQRGVDPTEQRIAYDGNFNVNSLTEAVFALVRIVEELTAEVEALRGRPVVSAEVTELKTAPSVKENIAAIIRELIDSGEFQFFYAKECSCAKGDTPEEASAETEQPAVEEPPAANLTDLAAPAEEPAPAPAPKKKPADSKKKGGK